MMLRSLDTCSATIQYWGNWASPHLEVDFSSIYTIHQTGKEVGWAPPLYNPKMIVLNSTIG